MYDILGYRTSFKGKENIRRRHLKALQQKVENVSAMSPMRIRWEYNEVVQWAYRG